ncbi:hypothetical protein CMI37_02145 [Candidatus Pacearchaeota archaeon]|nr:hypothetical protein [Candidatus Pacearchaeota archaeon]
MSLTSEQILLRWTTLMEFVDNNFEGQQKENIKKLFDHFEDRMIDAPASSRPQYHNCFLGGLLDHSVRVVQTALDIYEQFKSMDVKVTASKQEVILAAMFHDLGKIGDLDNPYYIIQTDEWRRNKLREWYTFNNKLEPMSVTDRSLWLLQYFNIELKPEVWKAIKLSDGLFEPGNDRLFRQPDTRNILHYIVHFADWMSTVAEKQHYQQSLEVDEDIKQEFEKSIKDDSTVPDNIKELKNKFNELFSDAS